MGKNEKAPKSTALTGDELLRRIREMESEVRAANGEILWLPSISASGVLLDRVHEILATASGPSGDTLFGNPRDLPDGEARHLALSDLCRLDFDPTAYAQCLRAMVTPPDGENPTPRRGAALSEETQVAARVTALLRAAGEHWLIAWDLLVDGLRETAPSNRHRVTPPPPRDIKRHRSNAIAAAVAQVVGWVFGIDPNPGATRVALSTGGVAKAIAKDGVVVRRRREASLAWARRFNEVASLLGNAEALRVVGNSPDSW
jgi:hypothetical protein